jgi:hypothetical protein
MLAVFMAIMPRDKPTYYGESGTIALKGLNPALGFRPQIDVESHLISFKKGHEEDRKKYIKSREELKEDKEIVFIDPKGKEVLDSADINLEHLRKLQDKHYEVDLHYEKTRDLYEKQRVVDNFL